MFAAFFKDTTCDSNAIEEDMKKRLPNNKKDDDLCCCNPQIPHNEEMKFKPIFSNPEDLNKKVFSSF